MQRERQALFGGGPTEALVRARVSVDHHRAVPDFPDALVALRFLERAGEGPDAQYFDTPDSAMFLDRQSPGYIGGILEMANARLYPYWADLTEALETGRPQNEVKHSGEPMFAKLYEAPERLEQFLNAMSGISAANFKTFSPNTRPFAMSAGRPGSYPAWSPQQTHI